MFTNLLVSLTRRHNVLSAATTNRPLWRRVSRWILVGSGVAFVVFLIGFAAMVIPYLQKLDRAHLPPHHPFRSEEAKQQYVKHYHLRSQTWPVACETAFVHTSWGETLVRVSGPENAKPLLLLPGGGQSSLMWTSTVRTLADSFRVYAIDRPGDFGLSVDTYGIRTADELSNSLDELLATLGLSRVHLVGMSYGGWQAAEFAIRHPERIHSLVLIAPAATLFDLPPDFALNGLSLLLPGRYFVERAARWSLPILARRTDDQSRSVYDALLEDLSLGLRSFRLRLTAAPRRLSDQELGRIPAPALLVVGEHETLYSASAAIGRLRQVAPQFEAALVRDAGHDLLWVQTDVVNERLSKFFATASSQTVPSQSDSR